MRNVALVTLTAALLWGCTPAEEEDVAGATPPSPTVSVIEMAPTHHRVTVHLTGKVASANDVVLSAEVAGRIAARPNAEGRVVEAGSPVIVLEDTAPRLERDLARVAAREAALQPDIPASTRSTAELRLQLAQDRLDRCRILAPAAATVETLMVEIGEWVAVGTPVARLVDHENLELVLEVAEEAAVRLETGTAVAFHVDTHGPETFSATVTRVGFAADPRTGKYDVELKIETPPARLLVGMFARAEIPLGAGRELLRLPKRAVRKRFGETFCFVVAAEGERLVARQRGLRCAPLAGDEAHLEVLAGVAPGERVLTGPFTGIRDGVEVRIEAERP